MPATLVKGHSRQWRKVRHVHADPSMPGDDLYVQGLSTAEQRLYELPLTRSAFTVAEAGALSRDAGG
jgi:hypothetical protein